MAEKPVSRRKQLAGFWARLVCFALLALCLLSYTTFVMTPKHDYGICPMMNLYYQPRNSVDVLVVGTSLAYAGINTNVLWEEYGIASYNLCSAEQAFWVSYYTIREALKTQNPKVILLDAKPAIYTRDYSKRGRTILSTFGIRGLENRIGAILACVEKPEDARSYIVGLPEVHSNYAKLEASDFTWPADNDGRGISWKGYNEEDNEEPHQKPSLVWNNVRRNMNEREAEYARKIFELVRDRGITLMLIGMPNPDYANDHAYYNALWSIAEEYGISGINYNDPSLRFGLRYSSDFADWQHLNVKGSIKFTRKLGSDLKALFDLPDRRGDAYYASYDECAEQWYEKYPTFTSAHAEENPLFWFAEPELPAAPDGTEGNPPDPLPAPEGIPEPGGETETPPAGIPGPGTEA